MEARPVGDTKPEPRPIAGFGQGADTSAAAEFGDESAARLKSTCHGRSGGLRASHPLQRGVRKNGVELPARVPIADVPDFEASLWNLPRTSASHRGDAVDPRYRGAHPGNSRT